jgi:hypothetical protein
VAPVKSRRAREAIDQVRNRRPKTQQELERWVLAFTGIRVPGQAVCRGHSAPLNMFARQFLERPALALWHGPRGSGKSFLSAIDTHLASRFHPGHETRILGGSLAQSEQIHQALREAVLGGRGKGGSDADAIARMLKDEVQYHNGSAVSILAASATSVRGPHVPSLKLDEVDEIAPDIRESAMGMAMEMRGYRSSVLMTSTWHRVAGPMAELIERGEAGAFPVHSFCVFEVLERCPEDRSGPNLEKCPQCPLVTWCHSDRDTHPSGLPKAKRSAGHYTIDSLIQKVHAVSLRVFESDYLCLRPRAAGVWFSTFDESIHVTESAEFIPHWPVHLAIDCGVHTGAVWFQSVPRPNARGHRVIVFADYFSEGLSAETNARAIVERSRRLCGVGMERLRVSMDPAGGARTPIGPTVRAEYERAGCRGRNGLESWPLSSSSPKADGLQLLEALLRSADGSVSLTIHPRCRRLIAALRCYKRACRNHQWMDYPEDPQHPEEDLVDPLCGGLKLEFPAGRAPEPQFRRVPVGRLI